MTTTKIAVFIGLYLENFYLVRWEVGKLTFGGGIFLGGRGMSKCLAGGGRAAPIRQRTPHISTLV